MGEILTCNERLMVESLSFYQRLALAIPDCVTDEVERGVLQRLSEFSARLDNSRSMSSSPIFRKQFDELSDTLKSSKERLPLPARPDSAEMSL